MEWPGIFLYGCLAFMAGVGVASFFSISSFLFWLAAASAAVLFLAGLYVKSHKLAVCAILMWFFVVGFCRFDSAWQEIQNSELSRLASQNTAGTIMAVVCDDPVYKPSSQQIVVCVKEADGKILIAAKAYPRYRYGDELKISGVLQKPKPFNGFDYPSFLAKDGIWAQMIFPKISLINSGKGNFAIAKLYQAKQALEKSIETSLPSPQDNLLAAILFGDQEKLSGCSQDEIEAADKSGGQCVKLKEQFNISGLRHLAAVSGEHITIMSRIFFAVLLGIGLWRGQAFWLAVVFIWLFILMIGLPASAVRAGIMGTLMLLAQKIGRPADAVRVVAIAAFFMVAQNPLIARFDLGFGFSFLAVLGMVYLTGPIEKIIKFFPKFEYFDLRQATATTLAALIYTLPLQIYSFGYLGTYSLFANILASPVVPFITIYGFILSLAGIAWQALGWLLMFPIWICLSYLLYLGEFFSSLPYSSATIKINFLQMAICYTAIAFLSYYSRLRKKFDFLR